MKLIYKNLGVILFAVMITFVGCKTEGSKTGTSTENTSENTIGDKEVDYLTKQLSKNSLDQNLRFERANRLYDLEMYDEAIEDLRVAISVDSLKPEYYHLLSDVFMDHNISSKALQTMQVAYGLFPERIPTMLKLAETYYILQQFNESIGVLNSVLRFDAQNAEAFFMLGLNLREMGDEPRALRALQTATEFDSKLIDAWLVLAEMLEEKGNEKALKYYETAVSVEPTNINAQHSLAFYKQNHKDIEGALETYRQINLIDRNYADAYLNAGILYLEKNENQLALEQFNIFVAQKPLNPVAHYYKGLTLYMMGDITNSKLCLKNALNLNPDYEKARNLMTTIGE